MSTILRGLCVSSVRSRWANATRNNQQFNRNCACTCVHACGACVHVQYALRVLAS